MPEVTKATDVNSFFDNQLAEPEQVEDKGEDPVELHYGLLAFETFDDTDHAAGTDKQEDRDYWSAPRPSPLRLTHTPLGNTAEVLVSELQRYEAHIREQQAQITRTELHRRWALERAGKSGDDCVRLMGGGRSSGCTTR